MGQERAHRRYSPSQAERFFACKGSNNLLARVPVRATSPYAVEGTRAHEVLEAALTNGVRDAKDAHENWSSLFFEELDDGTNEFYLSVQIALNHVYAILDAHPDAVMWVEAYVEPPIDSAPGEAGGFCDIGIWVPSTRTLYVIDYKHGAGVAKAVKGNKQVLQYAAGFMYEDNARVDPNAVDTVVATIIQPRAFHADGIIREHEVTPYEVWEYLQELNDVVAECEKEDAPLDPSNEDACRFCDARTLCPAREAQALAVASTTFRQIGDVRAPALPHPSAIDMNRLAAIRFHANTLRKWLDDVEQHCIELARAGHVVPGAKLVEAQARRQWYGTEEDVAKKLAAMIGTKDVTELYTVKLVPITTAEKMVVEAYKNRVGRGGKKKAAEEARQAFAFLTLKQSSGNLVMVDEDDPRPAVNKTQAQFAQIQGNLAAVTQP